jgi:L-aspartate oxidase
MSTDVDFLIIGSGLAGLTYALSVAPFGSVAVVTKKSRTDANSSWAQGGIAGVLSEDDSFELHKSDTLRAGAGLCSEEAVDVLVHEGPERIRDLMTLGAQFNTETDDQGHEVLSLGREGGHSRNRIVHTADYTGWECERTLLEAVKARGGIVVYEHLYAARLLTSDVNGKRVCIGAQAINTQAGTIETFRARCVLLATGGCGQIYKHTTNPLVATGDGVAMAWRAGISISNMEFIQFHPTTLYHPSDRAFLITEALRGEGGILRHADGEAFMKRYHPMGELAPRDIVARAIVSEMKRKEVPCVYLDATHIDQTLLKNHFPTVFERCKAVGIDITETPIPITPAQHYQCGGVTTDLMGRTSILGLYAAGEVACTGVHGANRLASNSLLEAMVFGYRAAADSIDLIHTLGNARGSRPEQADLQTSGRDLNLEDIVGSVRDAMQRKVGIVRTSAELQAAERATAAAENEVAGFNPMDPNAWEAANIALVGRLIIQSALMRKESRGLHYTTDYPETSEQERHDTVLTPMQLVQA